MAMHDHEYNPPPPTLPCAVGVSFYLDCQILRNVLERAALVVNAKKAMICQLQVCGGVMLHVTVLTLGVAVVGSTSGSDNVDNVTVDC